MKHMELSTLDDDYADKRRDANEFLQVLDHITEEFRKVRGPNYPDFEQVNSEITNVDIFRDAVHPIAKYVRGGISPWSRCPSRQSRACPAATLAPGAGSRTR